MHEKNHTYDIWTSGLKKKSAIETTLQTISEADVNTHYICKHANTRVPGLLWSDVNTH